MSDTKSQLQSMINYLIKEGILPINDPYYHISCLCMRKKDQLLRDIERENRLWDVIKALNEKYVGVFNKRWILTGEGEMLQKDIESK